ICDVASFFQAALKHGDRMSPLWLRSAMKEPHYRLLCPRRERPRRRRSAEQRDELAPPDHSITSSARASKVGGTSRLSALAVLRLNTNSNLVGWTTGRSAGLAPLIIFPA